jgi:hypothetical protein
MNISAWRGFKRGGRIGHDKNAVQAGGDILHARIAWVSGDGLGLRVDCINLVAFIAQRFIDQVCGFTFIARDAYHGDILLRQEIGCEFIECGHGRSFLFPIFKIRHNYSTLQVDTMRWDRIEVYRGGYHKTATKGKIHLSFSLRQHSDIMFGIDVFINLQRMHPSNLE